MVDQGVDNGLPEQRWLGAVNLAVNRLAMNHLAVNHLAGNCLAGSLISKDDAQYAARRNQSAWYYRVTE